MAATGYTPIQLYYSATTTNTPLAANLAAGELAINTADGKLFYKDNSGVVQTIASKVGNVNVSSITFGSTGLTPSTATTGAVSVAGTLNVANGGTGATSLTANNVILGNGTSAVQVVAPSTSGNVLTSNGTTWQSTAPPASVSLSANNTWTGTQTFNGSTSVFGTVMLDAAETTNVVAAAPSATTNLYVQNGSVQYYTTNAANNFVVNLAFSSGTSINTALATGQTVTASLVTTQGATAYYATSIQVDGTTSGVTTKWIGGAPTAGNASGLDVYRFAVIKTASATYTVLASVTQFK